ncbi:MAG: choice-of-anchor L domain-containing protein [Bacteroidia bacterium]
MRKTLFYISLAFIFFGVKSYAQITTANTMTPAQMVQNVLLGGGITVSNVTYTGFASGIATFTATPSTNLGFGGGIYLTTGSYGISASQLGPAGPSSLFQSNDEQKPGDVDLDNINGSPGSTHDAAVLEFDFVPQSDTVKFNYVFGSEEYNDYVNSINDVFGFILSGGTTAPLAATNIALIPGTSTPISINNVNNGASSLGTPSSGPCTNCAYFRDNTNGTINCVYDGLTTTLTAKHHVYCGEPYHIKIAIADVSDHIYDSGVFLEAGSFSSSAPFGVNSEPGDSGYVVNSFTITENCGYVNILYTRPPTSVGAADTLLLQFSGTASTADYSGLNDTIIFPVGVDTVIIPLSATADAVVDSNETIDISYIYYNSCGFADTVVYTITIIELSPISVTFPNDTAICNSQSVPLSAPATGGGPAYIYQWSNAGGNLSSSPVYNTGPLTTSQTYYVSVTDQCGQNAKDTINVIVNQALYLTGNFDVIGSPIDTLMIEGCDSTVLKFQEFGNGAGVGVHSYNITIGGTAINGSPDITTTIPATITFNNTTTVSFPFKAIVDGLTEGGGTGLETISININYTGNNCIPLTGQVLKVLYIKDLNPFQLQFNNDTTICQGRQVMLDAYVTGGGGTITYTWNPNLGSGPMQTVYPTDTTTYHITVHESCGNSTRSDSMTVYTQFNPPVVTTPAPDTVCIGDNYDFSTTVTGGVSPVTKAWLPGYLDDLQANGTNFWTIFNVAHGGQFIYMATDKCNYFDIDTLFLLAEDCEMIVPNIVTPNGDNINETFFIKNLDKNPETALYVYDRWGKSVFSTPAYNNGWKPSELHDGTYFYVLSPKRRDKRSGFFQVLKK